MKTREKNYDKEPQSKEPVASENKPLQILETKITLRPVKSTLKRETHNLNAREAQNYRIVEDLAQAPCAM